MTQVETLWKAIVLSFIISHLVAAASVQGSTLPKPEASIFEDSIALESNIDEVSYEDEEFVPKFLQSKSAFNEGKPFFVEKDPVSGQLDFNHKKSVSVVDTYKTSTDELIPLRTNEISPNIHDFLHLPVKYSSSKSVYPLVSSSYSNLKYQGNNKNFISNHKEESGNNVNEKGPTIYKTSGSKFPFERNTERPRVPATISTRMTTSHVTTPSTTTTTTTTTTRPTTTTTRRATPSSTSRYTTPLSTTTRSTTPFIPFTRSTTEKIREEYKPTIPPFRRPITTTTTQHFTNPTSPITIGTTRAPLAFPTENSVSFLDMLNSFNDDSSNSIQGNAISENMPGFQKPSGFKLNNPTPTPTQQVQFNYPSPNNAVNIGQPVSSMNNIKISPDQNVASFVLGSKQAVEHNGQQEAFISQQPPKIVGQVFNEPISSSVSIRFPGKNEENDRFKDIPVITGTYNNPNHMPNGHSAPVAMGQNKVFFPSSSVGIDNIGTEHDSKLVGTKIVFGNSDQEDIEDTPTPTHEVLPLISNPNQRPIADNLNPNFGQPPQFNGHFTRPPPFFKPDSSRVQGSPQPPPPHRQMISSKLPNILPQFRPNAKSSHGHYNKDVGVHRVPPVEPYRNYPRRPPYMPNNNRRIMTGGRPNYPPTQFMNKMAPAPPPSPSAEKIEANRRLFRIPNSNSYPTQALYASPSNRTPQPYPIDRIHRPPPPPLRNNNNPEPGFLENIPEQIRPNENDMFTIPPPQPTLIDKDVTSKLEPVVTLQMLQSKKIAPGTSQVVSQETFLSEKEGPATDKPVYVVYPVKGNSISRQDEIASRDPVVIGQRGEESPSPPSEVGSGYQNTPFFNVVNREQKPILTTLQKHLSVPKPAKTNFPYNLEQPGVDVASELDLKPNRKPLLPQSQSPYNIGEQPQHKDIIPATLKVTERPIAIAYTPKESSYMQHLPHLHANQYSVPNVDADVIPEIRESDLQTEVSIVKRPGAEIFQNDQYENEFQAPFHPSISLGNADVNQGWSILSATPDPYSINYKDNNQIDRNDDFSDDVLDKKKVDEVDQTFDENQFNPVFESGFKPIYPLGLVATNMTQSSEEKSGEKEEEFLQPKSAELKMEQEPPKQSQEETKSEMSPPTTATEPESIPDDKVMSFEDALSAIFGFGGEDLVTERLDSNQNALPFNNEESSTRTEDS